MIPDKTHRCWRDLVTGKKILETEFLGLQLNLKRQQRHCATHPGEDTIKTAAEEVHGFFVKYESQLANEIKSL